ncbi:MAG: efflux RND transporter periplasmic adaptor subunit [Phycisphaerales bacterium]|nr:efflux RND transporter periplasmic adaptor subunit [Phycisphaerales bacterium]
MQAISQSTPLKRWLAIGAKLGIALLLVAVIAILMLWLIGALAPKINSAVPITPPSPQLNMPTATATLTPIPQTQEAVGVVSPIQQTVLAPQIMGRIVLLHLHAGMTVHRGQVLATLDRAELTARLAQAKANRDLAAAQLTQALDTQRRYTALLKTGDVTRQKLDLINTAVHAARAQLAAAAASVNTAQVALGYSVIASPINGIVVDRLVHRGDIVAPGTPLAHLYNPARMQLVAVVREALARRLSVGQKLPLTLDGFPQSFVGTVRRVVPRVHAASRTFTVKVAADFPPGVYRGMYGRLQIPLGSQTALLIAASAVQHVGQLNLVHVLTHHRLALVALQLGRRFGTQVEVLSGLQPGDRVELPPTVTNHPKGAKP